MPESSTGIFKGHVILEQGSWSVLKQGSRIQAELCRIFKKKKKSCLTRFHFLSSTTIVVCKCDRIHNGGIQINALTVNDPWRCSVIYHLSLAQLPIFWRSGDSMMVCGIRARDASTYWLVNRILAFPSTIHVMFTLTISFLELNVHFYLISKVALTFHEHLHLKHPHRAIFVNSK